MAHRHALVGLSAILLGAAGCTAHSADVQRDEEQREFVRLNSLVRALQAADNADKFAALAALRSTSCQRLCEFRAACVVAFERHVEALDELNVLEKELQTPHADPARIGQNVLGAAHQLSGAQPLINTCSRLQGELARRL